MADITYYNFITPIGRLVSGSPTSFTTVNQAGERLVYKSGIHEGLTKKEYNIGVAFPKNQADVPAFIRELNENAAKEWPKLFDADLNCLFDKFANKITDGDSTVMNKKGKRPSDNPDWKGCWIIWFKSDSPPVCVDDVTGENIPPEAIRNGYYVRINGSMRKNTGDTPGMYMNFHAIALRGYGPEISNRPDPREAFKKTRAAVIPEGMSRTPVERREEPEPGNTPPPPAPPGGEEVAVGAKVVYQGITYEREQLIARGWTEAQVAALPTA